MDKTDNVPFVNILPFGMCSSMANPSVVSATAAVFGILTPMPCIPLTVGLWIHGNPKVLIEGHPLLDDKSILMCSWGGIINI